MSIIIAFGGSSIVVSQIGLSVTVSKIVRSVISRESEFASTPLTMHQYYQWLCSKVDLVRSGKQRKTILYEPGHEVCL